ncbi:glutathione binding-like protein [Gluconobacter morbifer]|nr:glutathione S-transferase [Gluconobacter morbifer]
MRLRDWALDDRCYAVRLGASLMGVPLPTVTDAAALETGPVLETDGSLLHGPVNILQRLTSLPDVARDWHLRLGEEQRDVWMGNVLERFSSLRRASLLAALPMEKASAPVLDLMCEIEDRLFDDHLRDRPWLSGEHPGVADVLLFPVAALSQDLEVPLDLYPAIRHFLRRFRALPGFLTMPGVPECH